jgi:hypothetical protein
VTHFCYFLCGVMPRDGAKANTGEGDGDYQGSNTAMSLIEPIAKVDAEWCVNEALTEFQGHPERCSNRF